MQKAITSYLGWKATHTAKAPLSYRIHLERLQKITQKSIGDITLDDISKYNQILKIKYSPASVSYAMTILKNFFIYCKGQGMNRNIDPLFIRVPKFNPKIRQVPTLEEINKMTSVLNQWEFSDLRKIICIRMLAETGMRVSELCDLNISDITTDKNYTQIISKKSKKERWVMWSDETHRLLIRYLGTRICLNQKPALFINLQGRERISTRSVERWFEELRNKIGITAPYTPHTLRHFKAHDILGKGGNVKQIQQILGHSEDNPASSFHYLRLNKLENIEMLKQYV